MQPINISNGRVRHQKIGLWLGPIAVILMLIAGPPDALTDAAWRTAAMGVLMAIWWATEAILPLCDSPGPYTLKYLSPINLKLFLAIPYCSVTYLDHP